MKVVITSATVGEAQQIKESLDEKYSNSKNDLQVSFHVSGVGILASTYAITKMIADAKPDLIMQVGIAGTFDANAELGSVVVIKDEYLADTGVEENGTFKDVFDLGLCAENGFPFTNRRLSNNSLPAMNYLQLREVVGITINEITTSPERIALLRRKYNAEIESMEGAPLHYCSLQADVPFIQMRALSNYIGERDKSKWKFKDSFQNLTTAALAYIEQLTKHYHSN